MVTVIVERTPLLNDHPVNPLDPSRIPDDVFPVPFCYLALTEWDLGTHLYAWIEREGLRRKASRLRKHTTTKTCIQILADFENATHSITNCTCT